MAIPRVFISSTYYDLKEVRNNIGNFVMNMGYEPVMHERSSVAYAQDKPLEEDCYHELAGCDIVVCVIGNKFGSQSTSNDLSVTMNEIRSAINHKKKVYIFIARDMYVENRTYEQNKNSGSFKSAYTDDLRVHEFILDLRNNVKVHVISQFDTTDEIVSTLKTQFAGLFQNLLAREASLADTRTAYDLQQSSNSIKAVIEELRLEKEDFFTKFEGTVFSNNGVIHTLRKILGIKNISFFVKNEIGLSELLTLFGFESVDVDDPFEERCKYLRTRGTTQETITFMQGLFDDKDDLKDIRNLKTVEEMIHYETHQIQLFMIEDDAQLPF